MEQSLPLSGAGVPRRVHTRQTVAAVLFAVQMAWGLLSTLGLQIFLLRDVLSASPAAGFALRAVVMLFPLAGFALLIPGAANRATKTAAVLLSVGCACVVLCAVGCALALSVSEDGMSPERIGQAHVYDGYVSLAYGVVALFAFSVILRSNGIERSTSSWIGLLLVDTMLTPAGILSGYIISHFFMEPGEHAFGSLPWLLFQVVWQSLLLVAYVRFARCSAFSGEGAVVPEGSCSPLNKYMAGIVVASGVTLAALWGVYRFAAPWLRTL